MNTSYVDYFYDMYERRNIAAHSRGEIPFSVIRREVIDAQCFVWELLESYHGEPSHVEPAEARQSLEFNMPLLERDVRNQTSTLTAPLDLT